MVIVSTSAPHRLFKRKGSSEPLYIHPRLSRTLGSRMWFYFGSFKLQFFVARAMCTKNHFFYISLYYQFCSFFSKGDLNLCNFQNSLFFCLIFLCMQGTSARKNNCQIDKHNTNIKLKWQGFYSLYLLKLFVRRWNIFLSGQKILIARTIFLSFIDYAFQLLFGDSEKTFFAESLRTMSKLRRDLCFPSLIF